MASIPFKLKNMNVFTDGFSWLGEVPEVTRPKLARTFEDYRGGGFDGPVKVDLGGEAMEMEIKLGGFKDQLYSMYGAVGVGAHMLRFLGGYQEDGNGQVKSVEIIVRFRPQEIDPGSQKPGEDTEESATLALSYYKQVVNGVTQIEYDPMNMIFIVFGVDRLAQLRAAIGA